MAQIVWSCIRLGHHPELCKIAKGRVIPKPGKSDYSKVRAYRMVSLLDVISKLVECTAAHLVADHLERRKGRTLHEGQYGCRKRRSCIDAVAVLMNRTQQAWVGEKVAGAVFMDVKSAFNNVSKAHLGRRMEALELELDLVWWTQSFMTGQACLRRRGRTGKSGGHGNPAGLTSGTDSIHQYLSGIFDEVEHAVPGVKGLPFADDIAWWAEGGGLAEAAEVAIGWARQWYCVRPGKDGSRTI